MCRIPLLVAALVLIAGSSTAQAAATSAGCRSLTFETVPMVVCTFDARRDRIRLFHSDAGGRIYGEFARLSKSLAKTGKTLVFAMNAGMYHDDRAPVGYYVEGGNRISAINTNKGPGNFHLLPNGVFYLRKGRAGVRETRAFIKSNGRRLPDFATQSGPMLVIGGKLHPAFYPDSPYKKRRNGVGVMADGRTVHFVIADAPVNFHTFARLFRDTLRTPNALFLDGSVSKLYAPSLKRHDRGRAMGPIVGVVE